MRFDNAKLQKLRHKKSMTQAEVSQVLGFTEKTSQRYQWIEQGFVEPSMKEVIKMSDFFQEDIEAFYITDEKPVEIKGEYVFDYEKAKITRNTLSITQVELADRLFVNKFTVSKWERGILSPSPDIRNNMERIFHLEQDSLLKLRSEDDE